MIRKITAQELRDLVDGDLRDAELPDGRVHLLDVRSSDEFVDGHLPGARHVPVHQVMRWVPQWLEPHELVVVIDEEGKRDGDARHTTGELSHQWFRRLRYLEGGMRAWREAGLPLETGGAAGHAAASECGRKTEFHLSVDVPWETSKRSLPPDPARVKYDDASNSSETS